MEHLKAGYTPPVYPVQPMPIMTTPAPTPMPMPMPMPVAQAPMVHKPVHHDIHLHAAYQQTSIHFPKPAVPAPVHAPVHAPVAAVSCYSSAGSVLVLFILLVIISRGFIAKC